MTTTPSAIADYASPTTPRPGRPLHRVPIVWLAVGVPALFVFGLSVMLPSL
jgi:hypothetical protein